MYGVPAARIGRTEVTEADRDEVVECLKRAYVRDDLTTDALGERVVVAHGAQTLEALDEAVAGLTDG